MPASAYSQRHIDRDEIQKSINVSTQMYIMTFFVLLALAAIFEFHHDLCVFENMLMRASIRNRYCSLKLSKKRMKEMKELKDID